MKRYKSENQFLLNLNDEEGTKVQMCKMDKNNEFQDQISFEQKNRTMLNIDLWRGKNVFILRNGIEIVV